MRGVAETQGTRPSPRVTTPSLFVLAQNGTRAITVIRTKTLTH